MNRYFIEVTYKGTRYAGFQIQQNAETIQSAVEAALGIYFRTSISLTGSSRTDSGVHALQNYFHFDIGQPVLPGVLYNLNALLPNDIAIKGIYPVAAGAHCRFDARARDYRYDIYKNKDPFLQDTAYYFPYEVNIERMGEAARIILGEHDFSSFSKRNTQVKTFICRIFHSEWRFYEGRYSFHISGNRFLRGMVRGLTGTMLQVGRGKIGISEWTEIINTHDCTRADFSVPGKGLWLEKVHYPEWTGVGR